MFFSLLSPFGAQVDAALESIPASAWMDGITSGPYGPAPNCLDESEVEWDAAQQETQDGQPLYRDSDANVWREVDLVPAASDDAAPTTMQVKISGSMEVVLDGFVGSVGQAKQVITDRLQNLVSAALENGLLSRTGLAVGGSFLEASFDGAPEALRHEAGSPVTGSLRSSDGRCCVQADVRPLLALASAEGLAQLFFGESDGAAVTSGMRDLMLAGGCVIREYRRVGRYVEMVNAASDVNAEPLTILANIDVQAARAWLVEYRGLTM